MARAFIARQLALGSDHADALDSSILLALMSSQQGQVTKAEPLLAHALSLSEAALGERHPTTARALNDLARIYPADEATFARARAHCSSGH